MPDRVILSCSARRDGENDRGALVRSRILSLMSEAWVADRVRRKLETRGADRPFLPPDCFSARMPFRTGGAASASPDRLVCRDVCGSVDCLCGSYPARLSKQDLAHGRRLERV